MHARHCVENASILNGCLPQILPSGSGLSAEEEVGDWNGEVPLRGETCMGSGLLAPWLGPQWWTDYWGVWQRLHQKGRQEGRMLSRQES